MKMVDSRECHHRHQAAFVSRFPTRSEQIRVACVQNKATGAEKDFSKLYVDKPQRPWTINVGLRAFAPRGTAVAISAAGIATICLSSARKEICG